MTGHYFLSPISFFFIGEGVPLAKLHQPKAVWRVCPGFVAGQRVRSFDQTETLAHADAKGQGAFHSNANVCR